MTLNQLIERCERLRDAELGAGESEVRLTQLPWSCKNASLGVHTTDPHGVHEIYFFTEGKSEIGPPIAGTPHFFGSSLEAECSTLTE